MSWTCGSCNQNNTDWASECGRCGTKKESEAATAKPLLFMVQESNGCLPECPEVYLSEEKATARFLELVNAAFSKKCTTLEEAREILEENEGSDFELRFWETTVTE